MSASRFNIWQHPFVLQISGQYGFIMSVLSTVPLLLPWKVVLSVHAHSCRTLLFLELSKQDNNFLWPSSSWNDYADIKGQHKFFQSLLNQCSNTHTLLLGEINYCTDSFCREIWFSCCIIIQIWKINSSYSKQLKIAHTANFFLVGEMLISRHVYFKSIFCHLVVVILGFAGMCLWQLLMGEAYQHDEDTT